MVPQLFLRHRGVGNHGNVEIGVGRADLLLQQLGATDRLSSTSCPRGKLAHVDQPRGRVIIATHRGELDKDGTPNAISSDSLPMNDPAARAACRYGFS